MRSMRVSRLHCGRSPKPPSRSMRRGRGQSAHRRCVCARGGTSVASTHRPHPNVRRLGFRTDETLHRRPDQGPGKEVGVTRTVHRDTETSGDRPHDCAAMPMNNAARNFSRSTRLRSMYLNAAHVFAARIYCHRISRQFRLLRRARDPPRAVVSWRATGNPGVEALAKVMGRCDPGELLTLNLKTFIYADVEPAGYRGKNAGYR